MSDDESRLSDSRLWRFLTDVRLLHGIIGLIVAISVFQVLQADIDTSLQFLSFLGLFALVAILFFPYTKPIRK